MVVRPLTIVNSQLDAREVERIAPALSGQSARQRSTVALATSGPRMPLTVRVSGAGNVQSVHWAVLYAVSPVQMVARSSTPGVPGHPPPGLTVVTQVEAISNY